MPSTTPTVQRQAALWSEWDASVEAAYHPAAEVTDKLADGLLTQGQVLGAVDELTDPRDVVLCAAGSMPGDLHKLWRVRDRRAYHVEYGYSCMGYEVPASIGIRLADESRDVFAMVGDGGYLMMPTELVDRGAGAGQGHRRPRAEPRLPLDRVALRVARLAALRHLLPLPASRRVASTAACCRSTSPRTPARSVRTSSRCTRSTSCTRRSRRPRPRLPTAAPSSSTSRPTRSCTPPTARRGGTCRSRRSATSTRRRRHYGEYVDHKATQRPLFTPTGTPSTASTNSESVS